MVKKLPLALLPISLCFSSVPVLAATTADLEKRLEQQETQIKRLENRLKGTRAAVKENRSRLSDVSDRLKINGFMTAGFATNDGDQVVDPVYGIGDNYSASAVSKAGVQMTFQVTDSWDATVQLLSRGIDDYQIKAEWAYLSWHASDNFTMKFGRQRVPYYLNSEYLDVGYALPWIIAPIEMYNIPTTYTDGISATYDFTLGAMNFTAQGYFGQSSGYTEQLQAEFISNQAWGANLTAEAGNFTFRVGYNRSGLDTNRDPGGVSDRLLVAMETAQTLAPAYGVADPGHLEIQGDNIRTEYVSAGFSYDNGSLLVMGEIANMNAQTFQPEGDKGYLLVGYRFGKWLPYVSFAKFQSDSKADDRIRAIQSYADALGKAMYTGVGNPAAPGLLEVNAGINNAFNPALIPTNAIIPITACAVSAACNTQVLTAMNIRSQLEDAVRGYSETIYNSMEDQIQEQQSYSLGLVYDVTPRVKAKVQATLYEAFGDNTFQYLNVVQGAVPTGTALGTLNAYGGFTTLDANSNGRFQGEPGAAGTHTAIYSFSIDAVF